MNFELKQIWFNKSYQSLILTLNQNSLSGSNNNISFECIQNMSWWMGEKSYTAGIEFLKKKIWKTHEMHKYEILLTFTTPKPDYNSKNFLMQSNAFLVIVNLTIYFAFQLSSTSCHFCCYTFTYFLYWYFKMSSIPVYMPSPSIPVYMPSPA